MWRTRLGEVSSGLLSHSHGGRSEAVIRRVYNTVRDAELVMMNMLVALIDGSIILPETVEVDCCSEQKPAVLIPMAPLTLICGDDLDQHITVSLM